MENRNLSQNDTLTTGQIAKMCRVNPGTVKNWIKKGILISHELPITGFRRVKLSDFLDFIKSQNLPIPEELVKQGKPRILIVDDQQAMVDSIRRMLLFEDPEQYIVESAGDGFEAGRTMEQFKPDLLILDLMMPRMDGFEVCSLIKANPELNYVKILVISGLIDDIQKRKLTDLKVNYYLEKPFETDELLSSVTKLLKLT
ncbi:MAG: CheY-like chemotaxis protein [Candidatus Omnitrophota bacterium]|jgi:CheY-like chemotaxis protein